MTTRTFCPSVSEASGCLAFCGVNAALLRIPMRWLRLAGTEVFEAFQAEEELRGLLVGLTRLDGHLRQHGSPCLLINSMPDHVHILFLLSRTMSISETVKVLKSGATSWVHTEFPKRADFLWQAGYAAFSVSQSAVDKVSEYIHTQKERHENRTFQNELRAMLRKHHIEYDERYLWD